MSSLTSFDARQALEMERLILANLPDTVGYIHPAYQATMARIEALKIIYASAIRSSPDEV